ncbi:MAG TPA: hypothetical protein VJ785_13820 [Anaerolineales bacterium]|nr:hypothetical protein [Anaerolineales bacterium]
MSELMSDLPWIPADLELATPSRAFFMEFCLWDNSIRGGTTDVFPPDNSLAIEDDMFSLGYHPKEMALKAAFL